MFDASVIANVLYISDGFHTPPFAIIASHTVSRRVSDRSVTLAPSSSSEVKARKRLGSDQLESDNSHEHALRLTNNECKYK